MSAFGGKADIEAGEEKEKVQDGLARLRDGLQRTQRAKGFSTIHRYGVAASAACQGTSLIVRHLSCDS